MANPTPYQTLAEIYDVIRPGYPEALIHDILTAAALPGTASLLEIGAGTGKATQAFLSHGFAVDAVEPDAHMAELLVKKISTPKLKLYIAPFETWNAPCGDYPLIYCAQAFHWLDRNTKFQKCARLLAPNGFLALFWYDPIPPKHSAAYHATEQLKAAYFGSTLPAQTVSPDTRKQEIQAAEDFTPVLQRQYDIVLHNTPEQALMVMQSTPAFSNAFQALSPDAQHRFCTDFTVAVNENGGFLDAPMRYSLYLLQRNS